MCAGLSVGDVGPGAPAVVHTHWTEYLCTFDMEPCSGHGELYCSTLLTPRECDLPHLYKSGVILAEITQCAGDVVAAPLHLCSLLLTGAVNASSAAASAPM